MKIELIPIPVTDVEKAKEFYLQVGFNLDHDHAVNDNLRFIQFTPPGSHCSIVIGNGISPMKPGSIDAYQMVVKDVRKVRDEMLARGIEISEIEIKPWGIFAFFKDPDGNKWSLQQIPDRK